MAFEREINGHVWTVESFTGRENMSLFKTLMAHFAQPISDTLKETGSAIDVGRDFDLSLALELLGGTVGLLGKVATKLSDAEFIALLQRLLAQTLCDGKGVNPQFDMLFKGDVITPLRVAAFVVEVHFIGPFVSLLGPGVSTVLQRLVAKAAELTQETSSATKPMA